LTTLGKFVQGESETLCSKSIVFVRYPFDEAAAIGISTIKQFSTDFKEVKISFSCLDCCTSR